MGKSRAARYVSRMSRVAAWLLGLSMITVPSVASAHGGRPQTYDVLFGASDADIVVPGTFGVMATLDGGASWDWLCIEGMPDATRGIMRPSTRAPDDTVLFAQSFGLVLGRDRACDPGYEGTLMDRFVADVTTRPAGAGFAAVTSDADMPNHLHLAASTTDPFVAHGDAFPAGLLPERVRFAPSDGMRVYVSGETRMAGTTTFTATLLVSSDGGSTWTSYDVPLLGDESVLRVLAVDPADPDHAFVVAQSSTTDRLIEVTMAGSAMVSRLQVEAVPIAVNRPFGLAFASDGSVWFGNTMAGLYEIPPGGGRPDSIDKFLHVACVVAHGTDLYLCGDGLLDDFALGVQHVGVEYAPTPVMVFAQLTSQRTCGTALDGICVDWWNDLLTDTGRSDLIPDAGADAGLDAAVAQDAALGMDAGDAGAGMPSPAARCACRAGGRGAPSIFGVLFVAALPWAWRRRRAR